ncbi:BZ3500_MvSof-1268-A1-R1_Chr4-2g07047 [Microbotryum saponariae]|uniref:BZ3500_MvSof-1268-A1-R1_Chr4-2g07047 protein n=1 Tax=Microbotryum saponariae TaxID=289078 RepID=A0A2X0NG84_9BASI|nr:BZ3500_MvSof-1268-A1-R1_Chr4-2g07047 [Microbotryum saponariae]SDA06712.1 BZ3501_MvSof-1269-A2-R1_Chr4-2g06758 [Microbotryum saponariae]
MYPTDSSRHYISQSPIPLPALHTVPPLQHQTPFAATFHERQTTFTIVPHPQYQQLQQPAYHLSSSLLAPSSISSHSADASDPCPTPSLSPLPAHGERSHLWTAPESCRTPFYDYRRQIGESEALQSQSSPWFYPTSSKELDQGQNEETYKTFHRRANSHHGSTHQSHEFFFPPSSGYPSFPSFPASETTIPALHPYPAYVMDVLPLDSCPKSSATNASGQEDENGTKTVGPSASLFFLPEDDRALRQLASVAASGLASFAPAPPPPTPTGTELHMPMSDNLDISSRSGSLHSLSDQVEGPMASVLSRSGQTSASKAFLSSPERVGRRSRCSENDEEGAVEEKDRIALIRLVRQQASAEGGSSHLKRICTRSESPAKSPVAVAPLAPQPSSSPTEPVGASASSPRTPLFIHSWVNKCSERSPDGVEEARDGDNGPAQPRSDTKETPVTAPVVPRQRRLEDEKGSGPEKEKPCSPCDTQSTEGREATSGTCISEDSLQPHAIDLHEQAQDFDLPLSSPVSSETSDPRSPLLKPRNHRLSSRDEAAQLEDLKSEWASKRWLFGPFLPGEAVIDSLNQQQDIIPRIDPPLFTHSKEAQAWIAYRRNYFGLNVTIKLPSAHASLFVLGAPVRRFFTMTKARNTKFHSPSRPPGKVHRNPPPILDFVSILQFDGTRNLAQATEVEPHGFLPSSNDPHGRELVSPYTRVQFRNATANHITGSVNANGVGKAVRLMVLLLAELEDGRHVEVGRWESDEIVVRGRCPKNFVTSGEGRKNRKRSRKRNLEHKDEEQEMNSSSIDEEELVVRPRRGTRSRPLSGRNLDAQLELQASTRTTLRFQANATLPSKRTKT